MFKLTKNISLSYMLPVSIKPGHTCSKEVTVVFFKATYFAEFSDYFFIP
jgi:hypothetical protein